VSLFIDRKIGEYIIITDTLGNELIIKLVTRNGRTGGRYKSFLEINGDKEKFKELRGELIYKDEKEI